MKLVGALALTLAVTLATPGVARAADFPICGPGKRTTCVVDGDTVWFEGVKYGLEEIDTPERGELAECMQEGLQAIEATKRLAEILSTHEFTIEPTGRDRYGRVLARFVIGNTTAGEMLVREDLARPGGGEQRMVLRLRRVVTSSHTSLQLGKLGLGTGGAAMQRVNSVDQQRRLMYLLAAFDHHVGVGQRTGWRKLRENFADIVVAAQPFRAFILQPSRLRLKLSIVSSVIACCPQVPQEYVSEHALRFCTVAERRYDRQAGRTRHADRGTLPQMRVVQGARPCRATAAAPRASAGP